MVFTIGKQPVKQPDNYRNWFEWWLRHGSKFGDRQTCQVEGCNRPATIGVFGRDGLDMLNVTAMCEEHSKVVGKPLDVRHIVMAPEYSGIK